MFSYCTNNPIMFMDSDGCSLQDVLSAVERIGIGFEQFCKYLIRNSELTVSQVKKIAKANGYSRNYVIKTHNANVKATKLAAKNFSKFAKVVAYATLIIDIGSSWYNNYNSGSETWISDSIVDTYYIGVRFAIGVGITFAFGIIPVAGWIVGLGVSFIVDLLIQHFMEDERLDKIKKLAAEKWDTIANAWYLAWNY